MDPPRCRTDPTVELSNNAVLDVSGRSDATFTVGSEKALLGNGRVTGNLTAGSGAAIEPGFPVGVLSVSNTATFLSGSEITMELNSTTNDQIRAESIVFGGTLTVENIGSSLKAGDAFLLFDATDYSGAFDSISLPALTTGLSWTNSLAFNGTLAVYDPNAVIIDTTPVSMAYSISESALTITWPVDHTGWTLEANTNSLIDPDWFVIEDSTLTNTISIPIYPHANHSFFRMRAP